jgi:hypothetical protein
MYLNLLQNELQELLDELPLDTLANFEYFQQDGAPAHRDRRCIRFLNEFKPNKWIGNHGPVHWPARSPDLTPMDFSIWGHLKDLVYVNTPINVEDLKTRIRLACNKITPRKLKNIQKRVIANAISCLRSNGGHFEHLS